MPPAKPQAPQQTFSQEGEASATDGICAAIRDQALLTFRYGRSFRFVEPHCLGVSHSGHLVLRGWQTSENGTALTAAPWKIYVVSLITRLRTLETRFESPRPEYGPADMAMRSIARAVPMLRTGTSSLPPAA